MNKEIVERATKMLPDYNVYLDDTITVSFIRFYPEMNNSSKSAQVYFIMKFKKQVDQGRAIGWQYISTCIAQPSGYSNS